MQTITIIVNSTPYGTQGPYNALRLATALASEPHNARVGVFLLGDGVFAAKRGQSPPEGQIHIEKMLADAIAAGASVRLCTTCCKERGVTAEDVTDGAMIGTMEELAQWVADSDKVVSF